MSFTVTAKLICVFVFAYAKWRFSHNEDHFIVIVPSMWRFSYPPIVSRMDKMLHSIIDLSTEYLVVHKGVLFIYIFILLYMKFIELSVGKKDSSEDQSQPDIRSYGRCRWVPLRFYDDALTEFEPNINDFLFQVKMLLSHPGSMYYRSL